MSDETPRAPDKPCPICGKPRSPDYKPFCSRRCADIDLGRWLKGSYVIPGKPAEGDEESLDDVGGVPLKQ